MGGSVIDVGFASTAFNFAVIPASLIWGYVADRYAKRRVLMQAATAAIATVFAAMFFVSSIPSLVLLYAVFGFVTTAFTPTTQLLIMELSPKSEWAPMFGRVSSASTFGFVLGVAPGVFWTRYFSLNSYLLYCIALQLLALGLVTRLVSEPKRVVEREALLFSPEAFIERIRALPLIFLRIPQLGDFRRFYRMTKIGLAQGVPLLFISMTLFFSGASLFFTSFTPFLKSKTVHDFEVFAVYLLLFAANTVSFFYAGKLSNRFGPRRVAASSILARSLVLLASLALVLISGTVELILASVLVLSLVGASFTFANTATSMILYDNLQPGKQGEMLGIYSASTGAGLLAGAFASGFLSFYLGYAFTFFAAATAVLVSLLIFMRAASQL